MLMRVPREFVSATVLELSWKTVIYHAGRELRLSKENRLLMKISTTKAAT